MCLMMQDYLDFGEIKSQDYDVSVTYDEFANPSFESEIQVLGPALSQGQISIKQYLRMLWAGKLSPEELAEEQAYLEEQQNKDNLEGLFGNEAGNSENLSREGQKQAGTTETEE